MPALGSVSPHAHAGHMHEVKAPMQQRRPHPFSAKKTNLSPPLPPKFQGELIVFLALCHPLARAPITYPLNFRVHTRCRLSSSKYCTRSRLYRSSCLAVAISRHQRTQAMTQRPRVPPGLVHSCLRLLRPCAAQDCMRTPALSEVEPQAPGEAGDGSGPHPQVLAITPKQLRERAPPPVPVCGLLLGRHGTQRRPCAAAPASL